VVLVKPTVCNYAAIDAIAMMPVGNASVVAYLLQPTVADSHHYTGNLVVTCTRTCNWSL